MLQLILQEPARVSGIVKDARVNPTERQGRVYLNISGKKSCMQRRHTPQS